MTDKVEQSRKRITLMPRQSMLLHFEQGPDHPPISYIETLVHLFKGNIGPGLFAMGDAFKNGGVMLSPGLVIIIALISVHCQHILINCSEAMRKLNVNDECADYAETVEQVFESGPKRVNKYSSCMGTVVNFFICITQLGFCCIYFVFISTNIEQILQVHDIHINLKFIMLIVFVPILLTSLIMNLKWLTPVSMIANICMIVGVSVTIYYAVKDGIPDVSERKPYTDPELLALFFGTAIFAFEGIALVLPLKNAMAVPSDFDRPLGVLNVGMVCVTALFIFAGFVGYMKWGEEVKGSLSLNLGATIFAQFVMISVALGVLLGYPLQFFIAIQIMWSSLMEYGTLKRRPFTGELIFRVAMVLVTLAIAEIVPSLNLFISLIGSLCSTALALVFPPIIELLVLDDDDKGPGVLIWIKNILILFVGLLGFCMGTYESVSKIIKEF